MHLKYFEDRNYDITSLEAIEDTLMLFIDDGECEFFMCGKIAVFSFYENTNLFNKAIIRLKNNKIENFFTIETGQESIYWYPEEFKNHFIKNIAESFKEIKNGITMWCKTDPKDSKMDSIIVFEIKNVMYISQDIYNYYYNCCDCISPVSDGLLISLFYKICGKDIDEIVKVNSYQIRNFLKDLNK